MSYAAENERPDEPVTVKEAARLLGYGLTTTYELFKTGQLRDYRKGRKGMVPTKPTPTAGRG